MTPTASHPLEPSVWDGAAYRDAIAQLWPRYRTAKTAADMVRMREEYAARLPLWRMARCPFCGADVAERVDTFSLNGIGWDDDATGYGWLRGRNTVQPLAPDCPHLRIVAWFLHLEGRIPDDLFPGKTLRIGPGVPSIMRVPMSAPDAVAVMNALPVGRWDDPSGRHAYTLFFLSYFTETFESWEEATRNWGVHWGQVEYGNVDYDLAGWAANGRLLALSPDGELDPGGDAEFPWSGIEGDRSTERIITRTGVAHPKLDIISRLLKRFDR